MENRLQFDNIKELEENIQEDESGHYYTHLPHILYSVINDQVCRLKVESASVLTIDFAMKPSSKPKVSTKP